MIANKTIAAKISDITNANPIVAISNPEVEILIFMFPPFFCQSSLKNFFLFIFSLVLYTTLTKLLVFMN